MSSQINNSGKNLMLDAIGDACGFMALYTDAAGTIEVTGGTPAYVRKPVTFAAASGGVKTLNGTLPVFDVPACTVAAVGLCTAVTGGVQHIVDDVTAEVFAAQGTYSITNTTITLT
jgi:hypothetical protein